MRRAFFCLLFAAAACGRAGDLADTLSLDLRTVTQHAAPQSTRAGLITTHVTGGDRSEGDWVALDSFTGHLSLTGEELSGFADRFCTELRRHVGQLTTVRGEIDGGAGRQTVSRSGQPAESTMEPGRQCAYRVRRGWVDAYVVVLEDQQRAFLHVSIVRFPAAGDQPARAAGNVGTPTPVQ